MPAPGARLFLPPGSAAHGAPRWEEQARAAGLIVEHVDEPPAEPAMWARLHRLWIGHTDELRRGPATTRRRTCCARPTMLPALPGRREVLLTLAPRPGRAVGSHPADTLTRPGRRPTTTARDQRGDPAVSQHPARAAVFSAGSWGTAAAKILADAGTTVIAHARRREIADAINTRHRNPAYFPDVDLPPSLTATTDPSAALDGADYLVLSIPAQSLRASLAAWAPHIGPDTVIVSLMKGIERGTRKRASEVIADVTDISPDRIAVLSGPNLAREIIAGQPAAATIACPDEDAARRFQTACHTSYFRPYTSTDVIGCEMGGAVKNIVALATGIAHGMGMGHNAAAILITRGLAEATRLATAMGAHPATLAGLSGIGDLVATCTSPLSRNRTYGTHLGQGMTIEETTAITRQTTEGVKSAQAILELARAHDVEMPITQIISALLHEKVSLEEAAAALMQRPPKPER
jgi:glycerol-3-phosphate dehydrogenase (NAD(P)+)